MNKLHVVQEGKMFFVQAENEQGVVMWKSSGFTSRDSAEEHMNEGTKAGRIKDVRTFKYRVDKHAYGPKEAQARPSKPDPRQT